MTPALAAARDGWHRVAEHVLAAGQYEASGTIRLQVAESARVGSGVDPEEAERGKRDFSAFLRYPADRAAVRIVTAVERRRPRLLIGASAVVPDVLVRLAPGSYGRLLAGATRLADRRRA